MPGISMNRYRDYLRAKIRERTAFAGLDLGEATLETVLDNFTAVSPRSGIISQQILEDGISTLRIDVRRAIAGVSGIAIGTAAFFAGDHTTAAAALVAGAAEISASSMRLDDVYGEIILCLYSLGTPVAIDRLQQCVNSRSRRPTPVALRDYLTELRALRLISGPDAALQLEEATFIDYKTPLALREWNRNG